MRGAPNLCGALLGSMPALSTGIGLNSWPILKNHCIPYRVP